MFFFFFFNDTATTEIYTLSLHDALPISYIHWILTGTHGEALPLALRAEHFETIRDHLHRVEPQLLSVEERSEEHTSELQSRQYLVCRLLLEKKKKHKISVSIITKST